MTSVPVTSLPVTRLPATSGPKLRSASWFGAAGKTGIMHRAWMRGYLTLFVDHVQGAESGADFDFLVGGSGDPVPRQAF